MPDINRKLNDFTAAILDDANLERKKILDEIRELHDASIHSAEDAVLVETYRYIKSEVSAIKAAAGRRISKQALENKNVLANKRTEIAITVFDDVRKKLAEFVKTPEYPQRLAKLVEQGASLTGKDKKLIISLRAEDMHLKDELIKLTSLSACEFVCGTFRMGGVIIDCPDKNLSIDETFDTAMNDLDGHFAEILGVRLEDE